MKLTIKYFIVFFFIFFSVQCSFAMELKPKKLKIAATTTNISSILKEICQDKVEVITIIQPTICPSGYDLEAATIKKISQCNIIMYHSWQPWVTKELKYKIVKLGIIYKALKTDGNFMIPYINIRAAEEIKNMLVVWDDVNKDFYEENFVNYVYKVNFISQEISKNSISRYNTKIICNNKIAPFLEWMGFDVVAKYGKSEEISPATMAHIIKQVKTNKVKLIVDNLQAGTDVGRTIIKDMKIKYAIISNFALGNSYISTLKDNAEKIDKALQ